MEWLIGIAIAAILCWWFIYRQGNPKFWKLSAKNPDEALHVFETEDCWFVSEVPIDVNKSDVDGSFFHVVPSLGTTVKVYGLVGRYEESQERFIRRFS